MAPKPVFKSLTKIDNYYYLHRNKERIDVWDSDLDELEDDHEGRGNVKSKSSAFVIGQSTENGRTEDQSNVAKCEQVSGSHLQVANPVVFRYSRVNKLTRIFFLRMINIFSNLYPVVCKAILNFPVWKKLHLLNSNRRLWKRTF